MITFTGIDFRTQIGQHSEQYVVTVYLALAGTVLRTVVIADADHSIHEWHS